MLTIMGLIGETIWHQQADIASLRAYSEINVKTADKISDDMCGLRKDISDIKLQINTLATKSEIRHAQKVCKKPALSLK